MNHWVRGSLLTCSLGVLAVAAACNIVGPAVYLIHGPEKTPAAYKLPDEKPAVIFIDDVDSRLPNRLSRQRIAKTAERALLDEECVKDSTIISSDAALAAASGERFGKQLGIAEIGEKVGAKTVIYARIENFSISPDGAQFAPMVRMRVKVVDVESRKRLFPAPESTDPVAQWFTVKYDMPTGQGAMPSQMSDVMKAEQDLADAAGLALARVFFEHESRTRTNRVGD
jgi:hypothetical protein